jgi:type IV pilus assembly protein PilM
MGIFQKKKPLWGIDLGSRSIKAVQIAQTRKGVHLLNALIHEYSESEASLPDALSSLFGRSLSEVRATIHFSGKVPPVIRCLTLPVMPARELAEAVHWEARKLTSVPLEEVVVDFLITGESVGHQVKHYDLVVTVVERAALLELTKQVSDSGLEVAAIDVAPLALLNTLRIEPSGPEENLLYADIGAQNMEISILKKGALRFTRQVPTGGDGITQAIAQTLGIPFTEAEERKRRGSVDGDERVGQRVQEEMDRLIIEVQRSTDYYRAQFREARVDRIVLMGGTPLLSGFIDYFSKFFEAPVEIQDPFSPLICKNVDMNALKPQASRFSLALGLALRKDHA